MSAIKQKGAKASGPRRQTGKNRMMANAVGSISATDWRVPLGNWMDDPPGDVKRVYQPRQMNERTDG